MFRFNSNIINISSSEEDISPLKLDATPFENDGRASPKNLTDSEIKSEDFFDFSPDREIKIDCHLSPASDKNVLLERACEKYQGSSIKLEELRETESLALSHLLNHNQQHLLSIKEEDTAENDVSVHVDITDKSKGLLLKIKDFVSNYYCSKNPKDQQEKKALKQLQTMYITVLEIYAEFLDNIPLVVLSKLPGFNKNTFNNVKYLKNNLKLNLEIAGCNENYIKNEDKYLFKESLNNYSPFNAKNYIATSSQSSHGNKTAECKLQTESLKQSVNLVNQFISSTVTESEASVLNHNQKIFRFKSPTVKPSLSTFLNNKSILNEDLNFIQSLPASSDTCEVQDTEQEDKINDDNILKSVKVNSSGKTHMHFEPDYSKTNKSSLQANDIYLESNTILDEDGWQVYDSRDFIDEKIDINEGTSDISSKLNISPNEGNETNALENLRPANKNIVKAVAIEGKSFGENINKMNSLGRFKPGIKNDAETGEFDGMHFNHSIEMVTAFKEIFGLTSFRTNQLQVINATMLGFDCFVLMPTGGGKSLCYQLPALLEQGVTIVVSPLKSLILDQVNKMETLDIPANHMSGDVTMQECFAIYNDLNCTKPKIKLLYVTPEKITCSSKLQDTLLSLYNRGLLARFVIDEAHCVSQWGHDFRPDYKKLSLLRTKFPKAPIIALTATATPRVREDVLNQLQLKNCRLFLCSFNRPNLKYIVLPKKSGPSMIKEVETFIKSKYKSASGIIYCLSRNDCDEMAHKLSSMGIKAGSYHAGMTDKNREIVQKCWLTNKIKVICATIAFGMGIDKPDVRYVIHSSLPKSIEGYYQESGRAGRDGEVAHCILYYSYADMNRYRKMMDKDSNQTFASKQVHMNNLNRIVGYCENLIDCRRCQQLEYFAEIFDRAECSSSSLTVCDNCEIQGQYKMVDVTEDCRAVARTVKDLCSGKSRFTLLHMSDIFKGANIKKIIDFRHDSCSLFGRGRSWARADILRLFHKMVVEEYLLEEIVFFNDIPNAYVKLGPKVDKLMEKGVVIELPIKSKVKPAINIVKDTVNIVNEQDLQLKNISDRCYSDLLDVCRSIASEKNITMASVINLHALKVMSERLPETEVDMMTIPHITRANFDKFGKKFMEVTLKYAAEKLCLMMDTQDIIEDKTLEAQANVLVAGDSVADTNWSSLANAATSYNNQHKKRKSTWGGVASKRFKNALKNRARKDSSSTDFARRGKRVGQHSKGRTPV